VHGHDSRDLGAPGVRIAVGPPAEVGLLRLCNRLERCSAYCDSTHRQPWPHVTALLRRPSLAQPWQRGRHQRPATILRQPLLSCLSVVAHRAGARVRGAALPHRLYAARTLACHSRVFFSLSLSLSLSRKHIDTRGFSLSLSQTHRHPYLQLQQHNVRTGLRLSRTPCLRPCASLQRSEC
jgi:hypothetical protein